MKKLVNNPIDVVDEMLEGMVASSSSLKRLRGYNVIVRADCLDAETKNKVALISGGGSGHEPAHAGYVGQGMLSAAVCGNVFASPTPSQVLAAIRAVTGPAGALLIVKNYTGDRLNFGIAMEMARTEGFKVETVVVADDCALIGKGSESAGRRGLAGTVFVHKVAGAAAESGYSLEEVVRIARSVAQDVSTMGVGLSPCIVPSVGKPSFELQAGEIELGLGIHGEPGVQKMKLAPVNDIVDQILGFILEKAPSFAPSTSPKHVALMVNNLGNTTAMEISIATKRAIAFLETRGLVIERVYTGFFMTALDMAGISLTLCPVENEHLTLLDFPTSAPGWQNTSRSRPNGIRDIDISVSSHHQTAEGEHGMEQDKVTLPADDKLPARISLWVSQACNAVIANSSSLNDLDAQVGDGDIGTSLERGAKALLKDLPAISFNDPPAAFKMIASILQNSLGGTSGPLYTVFFLRVAARLFGAKDFHVPLLWATALNEGVKGIMELGDAKKGDCTMLDALIPAVDAIQTQINTTNQLPQILEQVVESAKQGALSTINLSARRGRASYLGQRSQGHVDPGAQAIAIILQSLSPTT